MLNINLEFIRGMLFVRLEGTLDSNTYTKFSDCLDKMIYDKQLKYFVINLEGLKHIDHSGFQTIIDRYFDVVLHDGKLIVCGCNSLFSNSLGISDIFNLIEKTNNELSAFRLINI